MRSFKMWKPLLFIVLCILIGGLLNWVLIPPNVVRVNLQYLENAEQYDTIFLGTSHGQYGIDPSRVDEVTGGSSLNLSMADEYLDDSYYLLKLACEKKKPSTVIYELDPSYWTTEQRGGSTQIFFYREFPMSLAKLAYFGDKIEGLDFRSTLAPWSYYRNLFPNIPDHVRKKSSQAYRNYDPSILEIPVGHYGGRGFIYRNRVEGENKGAFNAIPWQETEVKENAAVYFKKLVKLCEDENIKLIAITTPVPEETLEAYPEAYEKAQEYFAALMQGYGVEYINFNDIDTGLDRSMTGYWDYDGHMDGILAGEFSEVLGRLLKEADGSNL